MWCWGDEVFVEVVLFVDVGVLVIGFGVYLVLLDVVLYVVVLSVESVECG